MPSGRLAALALLCARALPRAARAETYPLPDPRTTEPITAEISGDAAYDPMRVLSAYPRPQGSDTPGGAGRLLVGKIPNENAAVALSDAQGRTRRRLRRVGRRALAPLGLASLGVVAPAAAQAPATTRAPAAAQAPGGAPSTPPLGAPTPDSLLSLLRARFESGSADAFDSVYVDAAGRRFVRAAAEAKEPRRWGAGRVVWRDGDRAVLLVAGTAGDGTGADRTNGARHFSGLYEAARSGGLWRLGAAVAMDSAARILAQGVVVRIVPGERLDVLDTLDVQLRGPLGFAALLSDGARLSAVRVDGRPAEHAFGGGALWVAARPGAHRLVLAYAVPIGRDSAAGSPPAFGSVDNDQAWLPFFGYNAMNDVADIRLTTRVPAAYRLTTTLPQTETVAGGVRVVTARSEEPTFVVGLLFDRDWEVREDRLGGVRVQTFLTPAFRPPRDTLLAEMRRVYRVLGGMFGEPRSRYVGLAEERALPAHTFAYRANAVAISGLPTDSADAFAQLGTASPVPSDAFGHEIAHGWTNPAGPGAHFLREGWATFAESLILRDRFGEQVERDFWEGQRNRYFSRVADAMPLLGAENGPVNYHRGAWVLHSLRSVVGDSAFARGMRDFMASAARGPTGYEAWIAAMSRAAGRDLAPFLMPWLTEARAPDVEARLDGNRVILSQTGPVYDLPLELELSTPAGPVRRSVELRARDDTLDLADLGAVSAVRIDPEHRFLLRRHSGEVVRFELRAPAAKTVELAGDFVRRPIAATRAGDTWSVEIPMTEGRYFFAWRVDGRLYLDGYEGVASAGVRVVRPLGRLDGAYPR
ncbi:MAG TPA: hypothetical protein VFQ38_11090 [Longimicrobiales bacterium]|nr:hypothetical protein [Longimicrobiales bacterium]